MSKRKQIVCIGFPKWEGDYMKSTVSLMSALAKTHDVLYVDYPYTWKDLVFGLLGREKTAPVASMLGMAPRLRKLTLSKKQTIHLLTLPPFFPANWLTSERAYDRWLAFNGQRALKAIRKALHALAFKRAIVVNAFNPALGNQLAGQLGEKLLVYYCYDEISGAHWISKHGTRHEQEFLKRVDLTVVSSTRLREDKGPHTKACVLVKNGVALDLFSGLQKKAFRQRPRIGYLGSLDERIDFDLLYTLIDNNRGFDFQFVGRVVAQDEANQLRRFGHCEVLGAQPVEQLGSYVAGFDVGLIPFKKNRLTAGIYPLKINEYLSVGIPVITTDFADLSDFAAVAYIASDGTQFDRMIYQALAEQSESASVERRRFAQANSWVARAEAFDHALDMALARQSKMSPLDASST